MVNLSLPVIQLRRVVLILVLCFTGLATAWGQSKTYTLDADFDLGTLVNVNHDAPNNDQLQVNLGQVGAFPFINVAASARGTIVRINTVTGDIIGEYRSAPEGLPTNPSRTTVDLLGNVWTGNRDEGGSISGVVHGSVVKIGLIVGGTRVDGDGAPNAVGDYLAPPYSYNTCIDRDTDGLIKTSRGLGDFRPWPNVTDGVGSTDGSGHGAKVQDADDECILVFQRTPDADAVRHVSVNSDNDVWTGGYPFAQRSFHKLDADDGTILASFDARTYGCGGYGGLIDAGGILWSASISQSALLRYDPVADDGFCIPISSSYGMGIDGSGFIWNSMFGNNTIVKVSPAGVIEPGYPKATGGASSDRGVAVTVSNDDVWVGNSGGSDVSRLDNDGVLITTIPVGSTPTGVAVDAAGKVWATNLSSNSATRIDPSTNLVDLTVDLGPGAGPYNYSDMTGAVVTGATAQQGTWNIVYDGTTGGTEWGTVTWNNETEGDEPAGTSITVEARSADTEAGLPGVAFEPISNGVPFIMFGRFIEVKATLKTDIDGEVSPVLSDLVINAANNCEVRVTLGSEMVSPGSRLAFDLYLKHRRPQTVERAFYLEIKDHQGRTLLRRETNPRKIHYLDEINVSRALRLPNRMKPGRYTLEVGMEGMKQGRAIARAKFHVTQGAAKDDPSASTLPTEYALGESYPNPFNPSTVISYALPEASQVRLQVYNLLGEEVAMLANGYQQAGTHEVTFDASGMSAGVYLYVIQAGDFTSTKRMVLLK